MIVLFKPKRVVCIAAVIFSLVLQASAQQPDELQKQLLQLKQQYEQTTRQLQERIAALEQQIKKESEARENSNIKEEVVSAVEDAKKAAFGQTSQNEKLQGQLP